MLPRPQIPAAQYLRMSRGVQLCSIEQQKAVIRRYAQQQGFVIVRSYQDSGKSGLQLQNRPALKSLLADVLSGKPDYRAVLVYDISRWGRFQDTDEAAHYEFLCKEAGVRVHYCAERWANDDSMASLVEKSLKRVMAAEYSRELSAKCFRGQKDLVELGFRMGSSAGYGFRRMAISADGKRKTVLESGQYKAVSTDRIVLVPGPKEEVACVRHIYRSLLYERKRPSEIARDLNRRRIPYCHGKPWPGYAVERILSNAKYAGCLVWNRTSQRLRGGHTTHSPEHWIVKPGAFSSLVSQSEFDRAQTLLHKTTNRWSDQELLKKLQWLLAKQGRLTEKLITGTPGMASTATYYRRFGGFRRIYGMVNYTAKAGTFGKSDARVRTLLLRDQLVSRIRALFPQEVLVSYRARDMRPMLRLSDGVQVGVRICRRNRTSAGCTRWRLYFGKDQQEDLLLVCLRDAKAGFHRYYLLPAIESFTKEKKLKPDDHLLRGGVRLDDLSELLVAASCFAGSEHGSLRTTAS
jgi:DNA invertase Pin-like site-specific DNA recombinase